MEQRRLDVRLRPTEALNNLIKRIKRISFGFRNFENYRIRALLYAGRPNWRVLGSIVVRLWARPPASGCRDRRGERSRALGVYGVGLDTRSGGLKGSPQSAY
jgi:hypothetical protein